MMCRLWFLSACLLLATGCGSSSPVSTDTSTEDVVTDTLAEDSQTPPGGDIQVDAGKDAAAPNDSSTPEDTTPNEDVEVAEDTAKSDTGTPTPEITPGCTDADMQLMQATLIEPPEVIATCVELCGGEDLTCIIQCFSDQTKLSINCSACFGPVYICMVTECAESCDDLSSEECEACGGQAGCFNSLQQCMQTPVDPPPPTEGCNADDVQVLQNLADGILEFFKTCNQQCPGDEGCFKACLGDAAGITEGCADCYGDAFICVLESCADVCADDPASEACGNCVDTTNCGEMIQGCISMGPGPGPGPGPTPGGACTVWEMDAFFGGQDEDILFICFEKCSSDPTCFDSCISEQLAGKNAQQTCTDCWYAAYTFAYECAQNNCDTACAEGLTSQSCGMCMDQFCGQQYSMKMFSCFPSFEPVCSPGDQALLGTSPKEIGSAMVACVTSCGSDDPACFSACVSGNVGLDEACGDCFGGLYNCIGIKCASCEGDWSTPECHACLLQSQCFQPFEGCAGTSIGPPAPAINLEEVTTCVALTECISASCYYGGDDCHTACVNAATPSALEKGNALISCYENKCLNGDCLGSGDDKCWSDCFSDKCILESLSCADAGLTGNTGCSEGLGCISSCPAPGSPGGVTCASSCLKSLTPSAQTDLTSVVTCMGEKDGDDELFEACAESVIQCFTEGVTGSGTCEAIASCQDGCVDGKDDSWNSQDPVCLSGCLSDAEKNAQTLFMEAFGCALGSGSNSAVCLNQAISCANPSGTGDCSDLTTCLYDGTCEGDFFCLVTCMSANSVEAADDYMSMQVCPSDCEEGCSLEPNFDDCMSNCMQTKCDPLWQACQSKGPPPPIP